MKKKTKKSATKASANILDLKRQLSAAKSRIKKLEAAIGDASITLYDWDGYFHEETMKGNAAKLAALIEDAYVILQGRSWRGQERLWHEIHRREDLKKSKKKGKKK